MDPSRSGKIRKKSPKTRLQKSQAAQSDEAVVSLSKEPNYAASDVIAGKAMEPMSSSGPEGVFPEVVPPCEYALCYCYCVCYWCYSAADSVGVKFYYS